MSRGGACARAVLFPIPVYCLVFCEFLLFHREEEFFFFLCWSADAVLFFFVARVKSLGFGPQPWRMHPGDDPITPETVVMVCCWSTFFASLVVRISTSPSSSLIILTGNARHCAPEIDVFLLLHRYIKIKKNVHQWFPVESGWLAALSCIGDRSSTDRSFKTHNLCTLSQMTSSSNVLPPLAEPMLQTTRPSRTDRAMLRWAYGFASLLHCPVLAPRGADNRPGPRWRRSA